MDIDDIKFAASNPKRHDLNGIQTSVARYGFVETPTLNEKSKRLVAGHGRIEALRELKRRGGAPPKNVRIENGKWLAPILRGNRFESDAEATAYLVDANNLTLAGGDLDALQVAAIWEEAEYTKLLEGLAEVNALPVSVDIADLTALVVEQNDANDANANDDADAADMLDRAAVLLEKWKVALGDVWEIPSRTMPGKAHRIVCGDSTDDAALKKLMQGEQENLVFTDPPYNALKSWGRKRGDKASKLDPSKWFENDDMEWDAFDAFIAKALGACKAASLYVCCDFRIYPRFYNIVTALGYKVAHCIVWKKNKFGLGGKYRFQHELIIYAVKDKAPFYGTHDQPDVWEVDSVRGEHNTPKPLELSLRAISNSSQQHEIVLDLFLGSGGTLVSAERLGRVGRGMELEPMFVAVSLERLEKAGLAPARVKS